MRMGPKENQRDVLALMGENSPVGRYRNRGPELMRSVVEDGKAVQHVPMDTVQNKMAAWD